MPFSLFAKSPGIPTLLAQLNAEHPGPNPAGRFQLDTVHGVQVWYDLNHAECSEFATLIAHRAITAHGDLVWRVSDAERGHRFLSLETDPALAMRAAIHTWDRARQLCAAPATLHRLIHDVRRGRARFDVLASDAADTPLSVVGFKALLERSGFLDLGRVSARSVLRLVKSEPLLTHVLYRAWRRHLAAPKGDLSPQAGFAALC